MGDNWGTLKTLYLVGPYVTETMSTTDERTTEDEIATLLDAEDAVEWHDAGIYDLSIDVGFCEEEMAHSVVLDILRDRGYGIQYVSFETRSICFMKR